MKLLPTKSFQKDYERLPQHIQRQTDRKLELLLTNPRHPSLRTKKVRGEIRGHRDVFEGSISMNYRFIFRIEGECYVLLRCGTHTQILGR